MLVLISKEAKKKMNKQNPFDHLQGPKTLKIHGDI